MREVFRSEEVAVNEDVRTDQLEANQDDRHVAHQREQLGKVSDDGQRAQPIEGRRAMYVAATENQRSLKPPE